MPPIWSRMKSWTKWTLVLLVLLALLGHILDLRSTSAPWTRSAAQSGLIRTETRHLSSVSQGGTRTGSLRARSPAGLSEERRRRTDFRSRSRDYYRRQSLEVLHRLWTGNLTVGMLSPRLQKVLKIQLSSNKHQVAYLGPRGARRSALQLYCDLKQRIRIRTLDGTEEPFSGLGWDRLVPSLTLQQLQTSQHQSCAVVMSAGALLNSSLGDEIGKTRTRRGTSQTSQTSI